MVIADTCTNPVKWFTSGDRNTGSTAVTILFLWIYPRRCISWIALGFVGKFQLWALVLGRFPLLVGNLLNYAAEKMPSPSMLCITCLSSSAWGVFASLLRGLTPWTPHFRWPINVNRPVLLLLVLLRSLKVWVLGITKGLPRCWLLPLSLWFSLLVGSTADVSCGTTRLIFWRGICS